MLTDKEKAMELEFFSGGYLANRNLLHWTQI